MINQEVDRKRWDSETIDEMYRFDLIRFNFHLDKSILFAKIKVGLSSMAASYRFNSFRKQFCDMT